MVLAQIVISSDALNGTDFSLPMRGKASIKILSIETHGAKKNEFLQLRSDILVLPYSSKPFYTWYVEPQQIHIVDSSSSGQAHFNNIDLQGKMFIQVEQFDGTKPAGLKCVINLSIEKLNEYS
jgi:hypothetical protein